MKDVGIVLAIVTCLTIICSASLFDATREDDTLSILDSTRDLLRTTFETAPSSRRGKTRGGWETTSGKGRAGSRRTKKPITDTFNKYSIALNQLERGILEASGMNQGSSSASALTRVAADGFKRRDFPFARMALGHALHMSTRSKKRGSKGRSKSSTSSSPDVITQLITKIGKPGFKKMMALDGGVTLAFAIDTTGSMRSEIQSARDITTYIVEQKRTASVDYLLSPFNDPVTDKGHGPVTYNDHTQVDAFKAALRKLTANGGGDCDEMAITGIQELYAYSPMCGSPIYVFTDAGAKDATEDSLLVLEESASEWLYDTPLYFFLSSGCITTDKLKVYERLAKSTGGQVLFFKDGTEMAKTKTEINERLTGGAALVVSEGATRTRRSAKSDKVTHSVLVEDNVDTLTITVSSKGKLQVKLFDPTGRTRMDSKLDLAQGAMFLIRAPVAGVWKVEVTITSHYTVYASAISKNAIAFQHYFQIGVKRGRKEVKITSRSPLKDRTNLAILSISAIETIQTESLRLGLVDPHGNLIKDYKLEVYGKPENGRFKAKFNTNVKDFRLQLKGKTKGGKDFLRESRAVQSKTFNIRIVSVTNSFMLQAGAAQGTTVMLALTNVGPTEGYSLKLHDPAHYYVGRLLKNRQSRVVTGRMSLLILQFHAPASATKGSVYRAFLEVEGQTSKIKDVAHIALVIS